MTRLPITPTLYVDADACLALEDGRTFLGRAFGAPVSADGEVVFNTSMTGYQEIATDPSYHGQMVVFTHPQIGNYGAQPEAVESRKPWVAALVVRDLALFPNHWMASSRFDEALLAAGVPGIQGIDTRALTRHLHHRGTLRAALGRLEPGRPMESQLNALIAAAGDAQPLSEKDLVDQACDPESLKYSTSRAVDATMMGTRPRIALVDCGVKHHIARSLTARGAEVVPIAWDASLDEVLATGAQGVVVSNGPGDPERMHTGAALTRGLLDRQIPTLGICLGHQILGLAAGAKTSRLRFGHHGGNHPVRDLMTERLHITSQNHEFQVDADSIPESSGFVVSSVNLNDHSVEGLAHRELPAFSVQYHPEGCPGPQDNQYIFERFLEMVSNPAPGVTALTRGPREVVG